MCNACLWTYFCGGQSASLKQSSVFGVRLSTGGVAHIVKADCVDLTCAKKKKKYFQNTFIYLLVKRVTRRNRSCV